MRRISNVGRMIVLAFLVPIIVELRTIAGMLGVALSTTQYLAVAGGLVVAALLAVEAWNARAAGAVANGSNGA